MSVRDDSRLKGDGTHAKGSIRSNQEGYTGGMCAKQCQLKWDVQFGSRAGNMDTLTLWGMRPSSVVLVLEGVKRKVLLDFRLELSLLIHSLHPQMTMAQHALLAAWSFITWTGFINKRHRMGSVWGWGSAVGTPSVRTVSNKAMSALHQGSGFSRLDL